jgi:hypothetical protein
VSETVFEVGGLRVERLRPQVDGAVMDDLGRCCADYILMATGEPPRRDGVPNSLPTFRPARRSMICSSLGFATAAVCCLV